MYKSHMTGMRGVYLVASELTGHGFIASPTSRSARGADILVTDQKCIRTCSIQVKTNAVTFSFWLLNKSAKEMVASSHFYVFVNLRKDGTEYFIVPSRVVAKKMDVGKSPKSTWYSFYYGDAKKFRDRWDLLGKP